MHGVLVQGIGRHDVIPDLFLTLSLGEESPR